MAKEEENKALSSLGAEGWDFTNLDYCPQMLDTHTAGRPIAPFPCLGYNLRIKNH